jgi:hypothetical protein
MSFSWDHEFKILRGPFPVILGLDFLDRTKMFVNITSRKFSFAFAPSHVASFVVPKEDKEGEPYFQTLRKEAVKLTSLSEVRASGLNVNSIMTDFLALFSKTLGTANCAPYEAELSDSTPISHAVPALYVCPA